MGRWGVIVPPIMMCGEGGNCTSSNKGHGGGGGVHIRIAVYIHLSGAVFFSFFCLFVCKSLPLFAII